MNTSAGLSIWIQTLQALLTPVIGGLACWIAYQQYRTNDIKLRHDLFDRRLAVYDALRSFLGKIFRDGRTSYEDCLTLLRSTTQADFLFGPEIPSYIEGLYQKGIELKSLADQLHGDDRLPVGTERNRVAQDETELLKWFLDQSEIARQHFRKYLHLEPPSPLIDGLKRWRRVKEQK